MPAIDEQQQEDEEIMPAIDDEEEEIMPAIDEQQEEEEIMPAIDEQQVVNASLAELGRIDRKREKRKKEKMDLRKVIPYKIGDRVDLRDLLCNQNRDYLINNKGYKINVADLKDKAERVKDMKLEMLWRPKTVFMGKLLSKEVSVGFSEIVGKRIMVFCDSNFNQFYGKFKMKLLQRYMETKGTGDEFEVIHIGVRDGEDVPWLRPPTYFGPSSAVEALSRIFHYGYGILAFDCDGKVVRATSKPRFLTENFPFYAGSIEEEKLIERTSRLLAKGTLQRSRGGEYEADFVVGSSGIFTTIAKALEHKKDGHRKL
ncbi:hypothetical protein POM88_042904 [Heracleum sosnowskyi]|uniref:Uncharacterized protein n=1 Tax=Heracleum sosnowskyi TaxID=360622 RepID=A0AAD8HII9_9APIA|nr:hypothetical protein POM88_042904 [Heracleum sosnowskyi]